jgi:hypothetical protein
MYKYIANGMDDQIPAEYKPITKCSPEKLRTATKSTSRITKPKLRFNSLQDPMWSESYYVTKVENKHNSHYTQYLLQNRSSRDTFFYKTRHVSKLRYVWRCFHSNGNSIEVTWSYACPLNIWRRIRAVVTRLVTYLAQARLHIASHMEELRQQVQLTAHAHVYTLRHICRSSTPMVTQLFN